MGKENFLGPLLVGYPPFNYSVGAVPAGLVVGILTNNAYVSTEDTLSLVA